MMQRVTTVLVAVLMVGALAGCRTYGGYGSEEALYRQIERANDEFFQDLERIRRDQSQLQEGLAARSDGDRYLNSLASTITLHEQMIERHRNLAEELSEGSGHRALSRAYGAIVSDHEIVRRMYRRTRELAARPADADSSVHVRTPYNVVPAFYYRTGSDREMASGQRESRTTMADTLVQSGSEPRSEGTSPAASGATESNEPEPDTLQ